MSAEFYLRRKALREDAAQMAVGMVKYFDSVNRIFKQPQTAESDLEQATKIEAAWDVLCFAYAAGEEPDYLYATSELLSNAAQLLRDRSARVRWSEPADFEYTNQEFHLPKYGLEFPEGLDPRCWREVRKGSEWVDLTRAGS